MSPERTASIGRLRQRRGVDIPLVGQPGLDHHAASGRRKGVCDDAVLDLLERALRLEQLDHALARLEAVEAEQLVRDQAVGGLHDLRLAHRAC